MKGPLVLLLTGVAAVSLAACHPPQPRKHDDNSSSSSEAELKTISTLTCPDSQGQLRRTAQTDDGKSCTYVNDRGGEVVLRLVTLDGDDIKSALKPTEAELKALLPPPKAKDKGTDEQGSDTQASQHESDDVNIDLPGVHIRANDSGARVRVAGVHIDADDNGAKVDTDSSDQVVVRSDRGRGGVTVDATDQGAEIRAYKPGPGVRMTYILASDNPGSDGYRLVGYEARGPAGGPLVVATVKSKTDNRHGSFDDMKKLVTLNVGN